MMSRKKVMYATVGISSLAVELAVFAIIFYSFDAVVIAQIISYVLSLIVNFSGSRYFTFSETKNTGKYTQSAKRQMTQFATLAVCNLVLGAVIIYILNGLLIIPALLAKLILVAMMVTWNYLIFDRIIFRSN